MTGGLSTRRIAEILAAEGCPFDHDRVRAILKNPIYATGEYIVRVRGIPVAQRPIDLDRPVPLDRFLRVQEKLALRQARSERTPLGAFLLNYVEAVHMQCDGETDKRGRPPLIKGYNLNNDGKASTGRYRHSSFCPLRCRQGGRGPRGSFTWEPQWLEQPIVEAVREIAAHPEVRRQLALATRHDNARTSARLTPPEQAHIEAEIERLTYQRDAQVEAWIDSLTPGSAVDVDSYQRAQSAFDRRIAALHRRLQHDLELRGPEAVSADTTSENDLRLASFLEILTIDTPLDPEFRQLRARLFQRVVRRILIDDDGTGPITITIEGHLVPEAATLAEANPLLAAADLLDAYALLKQGRVPEVERQLAAAHGRQLETDLSARANKSVWINPQTLLYLPSTQTLDELNKHALDATGWRKRRQHLCHGTDGRVPAWQRMIELPAA